MALQSSVISLPDPEALLCRSDEILSKIVLSTNERWPNAPDSNLVWGLMRTVIAQQISTKAAVTIQRRVQRLYPDLAEGSVSSKMNSDALRGCGLSPRKAECCSRIAANAEKMLEEVEKGCGWEQMLLSIPGIGPWTVAIFRMLVIRDPDLLPPGDLGLDRAIAMHYPVGSELKTISECWKPYRTVACWYLWRSLGNPPLG
jgi:DNA-3-methyladenine glycosylase II